jgi:hypothetical protein
MMTKVTIWLTQDAEELRICDRYRDDKVLFEGRNLPAGRAIPLEGVTTNGAYPPAAKLQMTGRVRNERGEFEPRDEPLTVTDRWHGWPAAPTKWKLVRMLMELPEIPSKPDPEQKPGKPPTRAAKGR